ncbi:protein IQ-domain 26-like [Wolffia australiana]
MGRATRWLRSLLGGGKKDNSKRAGVAAPALEEDTAWLHSLYSTRDKEQSKHAIAVAAATAAAADAAVAAAQAAVAVVRLTNRGRASVFVSARERWAAIKIQTVFRGHLAKKALRALKALVKLQAVVRGYLVRRQAAATLHSMQALIRAQSTVRKQRSRHLAVRDHHKLQVEVRHRRSLERYEETRSECAIPSSLHSRRLSASMDQVVFEDSPKIVEVDPGRPKPRSKNNVYDFDWSLTGDECRFSTAQSTPRLMNASLGAAPPPLTPAKSVGGGDSALRRYQNMTGYPNYMAKTQSFEAKVRSQSAPKQRPEPPGQRRLPLSEMLVEPRASLSGVRVHRSGEVFNFKNAVIDRLDRSFDLCSRDVEREFYLPRRW